jgi:hypothetical protein
LVASIYSHLEGVLDRDLNFLPCSDFLDDLPDLGEFEIAQLMSTVRKKKGVGFTTTTPTPHSTPSPAKPATMKPILDLPKKRLRGESFVSELSLPAESSECAAVTPTDEERTIETVVGAAEPEPEPTLPHKKRIPKSLIDPDPSVAGSMDDGSKGNPCSRSAFQTVRIPVTSHSLPFNEFTTAWPLIELLELWITSFSVFLVRPCCNDMEPCSRYQLFSSPLGRVKLCE